MNTRATTQGLRRFGGLRQVSLLERLLQMAALRRQRLRLARLDDHLLEDIGLSRAEARREARRPAWDAPGHWRG
jgi:uncharacterized protein YjiS (DUF1127 family)